MVSKSSIYLKFLSNMITRLGSAPEGGMISNSPQKKRNNPLPGQKNVCTNEFPPLTLGSFGTKVLTGPRVAGTSSVILVPQAVVSIFVFALAYPAYGSPPS
jgi:hypothetical protein